MLYAFAILLFWISCGLLFYTFLGYGLLITVLARLRPRPLAAPAEEGPLPSVCVVLVAGNEVQRIADRLHNLLTSQYPADKLSILLVSDGSTDGTVARARSMQDPLSLIHI